MAIDHPVQVIDRKSQFFPKMLNKRLGSDAPSRLWAMASLDLVSIPKTARGTP